MQVWKNFDMIFHSFIRANRNRAALPLPLLTLILSFNACAHASAPPPGGLPRVIGECESGTNYNTCSVWTWDGSAYSAIWSNGSVGKLTVDGNAVSQLRLQRVDASGAAAGLTATYTGKWNGTAFSDGKLDFKFKGATGTFTWTASPAFAPVLQNPKQDNVYVNWYPALLTGYAEFNREGTPSPFFGIHIADYRVLGETPMSPGENRPRSSRYVIVDVGLAKSAGYPNSGVIAAIYSDGTTFGDPNVLAVMIQKRRSMIAILTSIDTTICTLGQQHASIGDLSTALETQHAREDALSANGKDERDTAYSIVLKSLTSRANNRLPPSAAIKRTYDQMNGMRAGLAQDPIKDASGQLLIPALTPSACSLP